MAQPMRTDPSDFEYPRETDEFVWFSTILVNGQVPVGAVEYAITNTSTRPSVWNIATFQNGKWGFMLTPVAMGLIPGTYKVWARPSGGGGHPVIEAGQIRIT